MITGILSATPKGAFFDTVIQDLQAIAGVETGIDSNNEHLDLPQVHAFNCLKDIFTDARFNTSVERHVSASLELAVHAVESDRYEDLMDRHLRPRIVANLLIAGPFGTAD